MDDRRPGLPETLVTLASVAAMAWITMAPQERMWAKLRFLSALHRVSGRLARRLGHRAMGDELAGVDRQRYAMAYRASQARDLIGRELERMRP